MKIGITGASGFIGTRLIDGSNRLAHRVIAFSRHPKCAVPNALETRRFSFDHPLRLEGCDAFVHLAGESIFGPWTRRKRRRILESRVQGTRHVVASIAASPVKPKVLVCASGIGIYGDPGEAIVDENSPRGRGFLADVCEQWEAEARRAEDHGVRTVMLRFGLVLGKKGGAMSVLRPLFLAGLGAQLGDGRQWMSWVHVSDVAALTMFAIENDQLHGAVNCVSPTPYRNADFTKALAQKFHRPAFLKLPAWLLKTVLGDLAGVMLTSQRVTPARATEAGFGFRYTKL